MRLAAAIISLVLMVLILLQSCAAGIGSQIASTQAEHDAFSNGGYTGLLVAFCYLFGGALVIGFPRAAMLIFLGGGAAGIAGGSSTAFKDLWFWGIVAFLLAGMSFLGWRGKRREAIKRQAMAVTPDPRFLPAGASHSGGPTTSTCRVCGAANPASSHFCSSCGGRFAVQEGETP